MDVSISNKTGEIELGAAVFAPVAPEDFYGAVLDVRGFPAWAPGVRRVEVISGGGGVGMLSEWEVSFLGFRKTVRSVLEEAQSPYRLRWTYDGPIGGWGGCSIERVGDGTLASFQTVLAPTDPFLVVLSRGPTARGAARTHLKRSLSRLGRLVAGNDPRVCVGTHPAWDQKPAQLSSVASIHPFDHSGEEGGRSFPVRAPQPVRIT